MSHFTIPSQHGFASTMAALLDSGASIDIPDKCGNTAVSICVASGLLKSTMLLVERGASVSGHNVQGLSPLMLAAVNGHTELVQYILAQQGGTPSFSSNTNVVTR